MWEDTGETVMCHTVRVSPVEHPETPHFKAQNIWGQCHTVLVPDEAFPFQCHIMRPYLGRWLSRKKTCYNYGLSCAWRLVEYAFGILSTQWCVYRPVLRTCPKKAGCIVKATRFLRNYMQRNGAADRAIPQTSPTDNQTHAAGLQPVTQAGSIQQLKQRGCFSKKHILWLLLLTTWRVAMAKWNSSNCITLFCFM